MTTILPAPMPVELDAVKVKYAEAITLQKIEGNPLDDDDLAMFAMFEREGWSDERCAEYIRAQALAEVQLNAAE